MMFCLVEVNDDNRNAEGKFVCVAFGRIQKASLRPQVEKKQAVTS